MAFQSITRAFHDFFKEIYESFSSTKAGKIVNYVGLVLAAVVFGWLILKGYHWHVGRRDAAAQYTFSVAMENFNRAQQATRHDQWSEIAAEFKMGYEHHASSSLAPYFLAYQAEALLHEGKKQEALDVLRTMLTKMTAHDPLFTLYAIKKSLLMVDSEDQTVRDAGLQELISVAHDAKNNYRDEALYYLGLYYAMHNEEDKARAEWNLLMQAFPVQGQVGSVYAELAHMRLEQM